jgi:xanthine dehydrogenase accessory factor
MNIKSNWINLLYMKNIYLQLLDHYTQISGLALATVVRTSGSTPQKPGSSILLGVNGIVTGTVGGGVVEGRVQKLAIEAIKTNNSQYYSFNLSNDISKKEEAICGGQISVLIDANLKNHLPVFQQVRSSLENRIPGVLITMVTSFSDESVLINRYWMTGTSKPDIPEDFIMKIEPVVMSMLSEGNHSDYREMELFVKEEEPSSRFFLEPVFPSEHLVIAGAGHIARALAHLADMLDFEITVVDDRQEFANTENIPEADHIIVNDIGEAMMSIGKNRDTYVVIVTRGHNDDAAALRPCIGSQLAYTGMIGSRNKIAAMRISFIDKGWATPGQWDFIHTPIGVDIKSRTVEEIAVSIAAELVLVRNTKPNG